MPELIHTIRQSLSQAVDAMLTGDTCALRENLTRAIDDAARIGDTRLLHVLNRAYVEPTSIEALVAAHEIIGALARVQSETWVQAA